MRKKNLLLRPPVLVVMVAMLLAVSGVLYAHWTSTLRVEANVQTGNVGVSWLSAWTNDDGIENDNDGEDGGPHDGKYDRWGGDSSADPGYDKDVAGCWADWGGDRINFQIQNGYPSYRCDLSAQLGVEGSVPMKATELRVRVGYTQCDYYLGDGNTAYGLHGQDNSNWLENWSWQSPPDNPGNEYNAEYGDIPAYEDNGPWYADVGYDGDDTPDVVIVEDCYDNDNDGLIMRPWGNDGGFALGHDFDGDELIPELTGDIALGLYCGTQVDPEAGPIDVAGWVHVEQPAWQNYGYQWSLEQDFVNWNEFSYCLCTDGVVAADADGNPIGLVDRSVQDTCLKDF